MLTFHLIEKYLTSSLEYESGFLVYIFLCLVYVRVSNG